LGLALIAVGMPLSKFLMSVGQFALAASFLLDGKFKTKTQWFLINTSALVLCGLFFIHLLGLIHSSDYAAGLQDLRIKFPLLVMPILIASSEPLQRKQFENILLLFVLAVFAGTVVSMAVLVGIIYRPITDIRDIFMFGISHIRFALFTCLSIFFIIHLLWFHREYTPVKKVLLTLLVVWLAIFLVIMESVTGVAVLVVTAIVLLFYYAAQKGALWKRLVALCFALALPVSAIYIVREAVKEFYFHYDIDLKSLQKTTPHNNTYLHWPGVELTENGYRTWIYVCEPEMREEWNKRGSIRYDSSDMKGQQLHVTLIRYLTSKGLRKDEDGVKMLTDEDIRAIERGVANVNYEGFNPKARIQQIIWEYNHYKETGDPSGHSVMQRLEFWQAGWNIFTGHFWTGVGTGDLENAYQHEYEKKNYPLEEKYRLRAHDQYLAIADALGIFGLLYFLLSLVYPMIKRKKAFNFLYITFWITALLSMITEDTLETQAGVTFFAFFNCLYLFAYDPGEEGNRGIREIRKIGK